MLFLNRLLSSTWLLHLIVFAAVVLWLKLGTPLPQEISGVLVDHNSELVLTAGGLVVILALLYQSANTAFKAAVLMVSYLWVVNANSQLAVAAIAIVVPLNLLIFALMEERGLLGPPGLIRLAIVCAQAVLVVALFDRQPDILSLLTQNKIFPEFLTAWLALPDQGLALLAVSSGMLVFLACYERVPMVIGTLTAMLISALAINQLAQDPASATAAALFTIALLVFLIAILQEVHSLAFRDGLTGLPNRRAMDSMLQRLGSRYAIAMMDVDHFKKFNDTYGHEVGDQVLCRVARVIEQVGEGGRPFRYGGEEFSVIFPGRNIEAVSEELDELREQIADTPFMVREPDRPDDPERGQKHRGVRKDKGKQVQITISIGVAEPSGQSAEPSEVVQAADQALYRAKEKGRNNVSE
ncbi:diguanylate cyclase [Halorhodospira halochloris]|uniref:diguanylate cyclase n=1 Tax=Halorhodospira halochloris TaxID=1052 RepID=A0A0X8XA28_HALHR|nr:diguanylate cyclase [Halorhodospira halochloris]MBK1651980.1 hypothetical protein [Halorhodospira halochloris]MCG5530330.1 diguanylate cyclase [Halorhodospira halochloris]MCG5547922.1 diguanylate cyclase [Halorhodospira halochloris]BAU58275.1 GGDEF domain protein [Halorhodospira halochloris]